MKRKTIGVLVGGITDDFTRLLCHGVIERAKTLDVNIVVIPGKFLDREYSETSDIYYEYQYQTLFSYATKENLDGVIVASSCIGCFATKERIREFMKRYLRMPCVIVAADEPNQICVRYDNGAGIREGLNYMIEELGYTRIGMIGGPDSNYDAKERRRTYIEVLEAHGIEFDPGLYVEGNLTSESKEVFRDILDRNPDMQGVFCVNDSCASGFYEELKARDILPGRDISVMGYDDIEWATQIYPTLSTVRADAGKLGSEAVNLMVRLIDGKQVESKILPTEFIRRDSFCKKGGSRKRSKNVIEGYLSMNHMLSEQWEERNKTQFKMKTFIQKVLSFDRGNDRSYGEILGTMDWLDIENAFIFLYKEPIIHLIGEPFELPDQLYLKTKDLKEKVSSVITVNQKVSSLNLYDFESLGVEEAGIYVLLPLYSNEILYGVLLCDLTEGVLVNGEFLGNQVSAAVKMINLLKTNEEIMKRLEESMAILQKNNIMLDNLSKQDPLTGIMNRRGFFDRSLQLLKECEEQKRTATVFYADMNSLKIINDRYGHDEGDFSLKTIGDILIKSVGDNGIVGRIGGDEYCCLVLGLKDSDAADAFAEEVYSSFEEFNEHCDKPYKVSVSLGNCQIVEYNKKGLQNAMTMADEKLYEVKKYRKKDVVKVKN